MPAHDDLIYEPNIIKNAIRKSSEGGYCVYFLIKDEAIVYIGQTSDFSKRIQSHICDKRKDFDSYFVRNCDFKEVDALESFLILYHQPKYNMLLGESNKRKFHTPIKASKLLDSILNNN